MFLIQKRRPESGFSPCFFFFPKRLENVKFRFKTFFKGANYLLLFFKGLIEHKMFVFKIRYWIYPLTCGHIFALPIFNPNQVPWDQWATYNILGIYIYLSLRNVRLCFPKKKKIKTRKLRTLICIINTRVCEPGSGRCVSSPSQN